MIFGLFFNLIPDGLMQVDKAINPEEIKLAAAKRDDVICISALTGEGLDDFCSAIQEKLKVHPPTL